jgi:hypothetical protein
MHSLIPGGEICCRSISAGLESTDVGQLSIDLFILTFLISLPLVGGGVPRTMCITKRRLIPPGPILTSLLGSFAWFSSPCAIDGGATRPAKASAAKAAIVLPKDPKAVVLSYDPGAGGFVRKGASPYLRIQANGQVTVTNLLNGTKKESKLTVKQVKDLLGFVIQKSDFFDLSDAKINKAIQKAAGKGPFIAIGGAGTTVISAEANGKKHTVSYRGAAAYLRVYPKVKLLAQFVAIEKRLSDLAASVEKGK